MRTVRLETQRGKTIPSCAPRDEACLRVDRGEHVVGDRYNEERVSRAAERVCDGSAHTSIRDTQGRLLTSAMFEFP